MKMLMVLVLKSLGVTLGARRESVAFCLMNLEMLQFLTNYASFLGSMTSYFSALICAAPSSAYASTV
jgi:hypothetical protein